MFKAILKTHKKELKYITKLHIFAHFGKKC